MEENYLTNAQQQFTYYKLLAERTFKQLADEELFWQFNPESNSIAIIVKHLAGNMRSRWTDFLTTDGEKSWRNREQEFVDDLADRVTMLAAWEEGWACLFQALATIDADNFATVVYIRNQGHTIVEAVNRQIAHIAYHVGQIVYLGRMQRGAAWKSLSIPKGKSEVYNQQKFDQPKRKEHFTKDFLRKKS